MLTSRAFVDSPPACMGSDAGQSLSSLLDSLRRQAEEEKERGNAAFAAGQCISLTALLPLLAWVDR